MARLTLEHLGPLLKERRGGRGLRQVAEEVGISAATLSRVEAGKQPDLDSFRKICSWLGVDPGELLGHRTKAGSGSGSGSGSDAKVVMAHFKAGKTMSPKTAQQLGVLILAIHEAARARHEG